MIRTTIVGYAADTNEDTVEDDIVTGIKDELEVLISREGEPTTMKGYRIKIEVEELPAP